MDAKQDVEGNCESGVISSECGRYLAPRARLELAILRLTAEEVKNLSALSGVAYEKTGAILPTLVAPNPAPKFEHCTRTCNLHRLWFGGKKRCESQYISG